MTLLQRQFTAVPLVLIVLLAGCGGPQTETLRRRGWTTTRARRATSGLTVVFDSDVSSVTAEHHSVGTGDDSSNSVAPEYACLTASEELSDV